MLKIRTLFIVFIPAFLFAAVVLFVRVAQYEPLFPDPDDVPAHKKTDKLIIPVFADDPILGNKKSAITVVAFEDFGCHGCKAQDPLLDELVTRYPVKVIWKSLPVTRFPYNTNLAHRYGYCANRQDGFEEFKRFAFVNNDALSEATLKQITASMDMNIRAFDRCLSSAQTDQHMLRTEEIARALNIQSVPAFFVNNVQITAPESLDQWVAALNL